MLERLGSGGGKAALAQTLMDGDQGWGIVERGLQLSEGLVRVGGDLLEEGLLHRMSRRRRWPYRDEAHPLWLPVGFVEESTPEKIGRGGCGRQRRPPPFR
jgi:hypothetical protein